jgi:hypothetical protein
MSRETLTHLNTQTLIGYTSKRGQAWHYRADYQGSEPNHYQHAIPVADVRRRLFCWSPVEADLQAVTIDTDGSPPTPTRLARRLSGRTPAPFSGSSAPATRCTTTTSG